MIIGYYPGGGGNRYYQYSNGNEFSQSGIAYDNIVSLGCKGHYLNADTQLEKLHHPTILLHCVNYDRIYQVTGRKDITIIKSNLKDSLCREWSIKGKYKPMVSLELLSYEDFLLELYNAIKDPMWPDIKNIVEYKNLPKKIYDEVELNFIKNKNFVSNDSIYNFLTAAYSAIIWHNDFYKQYPLDPGPAVLVDIDNDTTKFGQIMRQELQLYQDNKLFNFAWEVFQSLGKNAPIITLYQESNLYVE